MNSKEELKKIVTREQLADALYYFAKKASVDNVLREISEERSPFKKADKGTFTHEMLIMIFWIIDKFFADKERKLTAAIHKKYFTDINISNNQKEEEKELSFIVNRYKEYYDAYKDGAEVGPEQIFLWSVIAKNRLQQDGPVINALATLLVATDVMLLIKHLTEVFNQYEIID